MTELPSEDLVESFAVDHLTQAGFTPASPARAGSAAIAANEAVVPEASPPAQTGSGPPGAAGP
jgi:hypothetical protein